MKCKSCKQTVEAALVKKNNGQCPLCKKPAGKKYRYPARPYQKGKAKRLQQETAALGSIRCDFTSGKYNENGMCKKTNNMVGFYCRKCLK
jgi:hypothetical protein